MQPTLVQIVGAGCFLCALVHTFSTRQFERLAHRDTAHAGLWRLLGEVETVFGLWALPLVACIFAAQGPQAGIAYVEGRDFAEPLFVFAIMVVAASRPIIEAAEAGVAAFARALPLPPAMAVYFAALFAVPLLGSFITEPAAMTLAAMILRDRFFARGLPERLKYATLGVLFVNVSIGGTLTPFAAPPVLMVAGTWGWDLAHMLRNFAGPAALAVALNALAATLLFGRRLRESAPAAAKGRTVPAGFVLLHVLLLAGIVVFAHHPAFFMGLLLCFLGIAEAYPRFQNRLILKEALLVAFFLAGLVVLGGMQEWWLRPVLLGLDSAQVFFGAAALTAVTDNAALTYLGSLVEGLSPAFQHALVAGAVTGGGLTVIANAPNPAGLSILKGFFEDRAVSPLRLLLAALPPTAVAAAAFRLL